MSATDESSDMASNGSSAQPDNEFDPTSRQTSIDTENDTDKDKETTQSAGQIGGTKSDDEIQDDGKVDDGNIPATEKEHEEAHVNSPPDTEEPAGVNGCYCSQCEEARKQREFEKCWKLEVDRVRVKTSRYDSNKVMPDTAENADEVDIEGFAKGGYVLRRVREFNESGDYTHTRLEIRSQILARSLKNVIPRHISSDYKSLSGSAPIIVEPYMMIFHHWDLIRARAAAATGDEKAQLDFLLQVVQGEVPAVTHHLTKIIAKELEELPYSIAWIMYKPGAVVYMKEYGDLGAYTVEKVSGCVKNENGTFTPMSVTLKSWVFDENGQKLVQLHTERTMEPYDGNVKPSQLRFVPSGYLPEESAKKMALINRGKQYWSYRGQPSYLEYDGDAWIKTMNDDTVRVVVDISKDPSTGGTKKSGCDDSCTICPNHEIDDPVTDPESNPEGTFLFCPPYVYAFSLVKKSWERVGLSSLSTPKYDEEIFKKLVVNESHKTVVKAMVQSYLSKESRFSDFVRGKGRGLIILLHGPPGTGKTLTAECVAESQKMPLYTITCGNLGVDHTTLERNLQDVFEKATRWNAVLLLDEADVFLQERSIRQLERNALVSVFLRELEYFDGILFLTTNRPGTLDEAFQSRIHIVLTMPKLDKKSQAKIWFMFLKDLMLNDDIAKKTVRMIITKTEKDELNGRQIRNSIRSALALAAEEGQPLDIKHLEKVTDLTRAFSSYLFGLNKMNTSRRQELLGSRIDDSVA